MWTLWTKLTWTKLTAALSGTIVMFLDGCNPEVRDVWLNGIESTATGVVSALTGLLTTAVSAFITGATQTDDGVTTVEAVFEWLTHAVC